MLGERLERTRASRRGLAQICAGVLRWVAIKRKSLVRVFRQAGLKSSRGALWTIAELKRLGTVSTP